MNYKNDLYFLPILIKAIESEEPVEAIKEAFMQIAELGKREEYHVGYKQFYQFLEIGLSSGEEARSEFEDKLIVGVASDSLNVHHDKMPRIIKMIKNNKDLSRQLSELTEEYKFKVPLKIEIYKDENLLGLQKISHNDDEFVLKGIEPGDYSIRLSNGRILWSGKIQMEDVVIGETNKDQEYKMAAETEGIEAKLIRTIDIVKDEIQLQIYSGLEYGKFRIVIK